jgi:hypothetical protein
MNFKEFFIIRELNQQYLDKLNLNAVKLPWDNIFGDKIRIKLDYVPDYSFLNSDDIIYIKDKKAFFKKKDSSQKNKLKMSKAVASKEKDYADKMKMLQKEHAERFKKLLDSHPEEKAALEKYMHLPSSFMIDDIAESGFSHVFDYMYRREFGIREIIDYLLELDIADGRTRMEYWWEPYRLHTVNTKDFSLLKNSSEKYSLIISRAPIDVIRASDYTNIMSCMSPAGRNSDQEGIHFSDLQETCLAGAGIVYILPETKISNEDLQRPELFKDVQRQIEGHSPIARLLVRQFVNDSGEQIMVPESRIFGSLASNMKRVAYKEVVDILKELQSIQDLDPDEWHMKGSAYLDLEINEKNLLLNFIKS